MQQCVIDVYGWGWSSFLIILYETRINLSEMHFLFKLWASQISFYTVLLRLSGKKEKRRTSVSCGDTTIGKREKVFL